MWTTGIFISEMSGTFVLTFMTLFIVLASKSAIINLKEHGKVFFVAIGIGVAFTLGILVATGIATAQGITWLGHVNPATTLMEALAMKNYHKLVPALTGELTGAMGGALIVLGMFTMTYRKSPVAFQDAKEAFAMPDNSRPIVKSFMGEMLASFILLGVIMAGMTARENFLFSGMAMVLVLLTFGLRFNLILNPFATIIPMIIGLFITKPHHWNAALMNLGVGVMANLSTAACLGAIYGAL